MAFNLGKVLRVVFWILFIFLAFQTGVTLHFLRSLPTHPLTAWDYYHQGKTLESQEKFKKAEQSLEKALRIDPTFYRAMMEMGYLYIAKGEFVYGRSWYEKAQPYIKNDPYNQQSSIYTIGKTYLFEDDSSKSWDLLHQAYAAKVLTDHGLWPNDPTDPAYYVMTNNRPKFDEMAKDFYPQQMAHRYSQLSKWSKFCKFDKMISDSQAYLDRNPNSKYDDLFIRWQALAYLRKGDYAQSLALLDRIDPHPMKDEDKAWGLEIRYDDYVGQKKYQKALAALHQLSMDYPKQRSAFWIKCETADLFKKQHNTNGERDLYKDILQNYPEKRGVYKFRIRLVEILTSEGQYEEAFKYYKDETIAFPKFLWAILGTILSLGFLIFLLFAFSRIFFVQELERIKTSGFRLTHLWLIVSAYFFIDLYAPFVFFQLNSISNGLLERMSLNPIVAGMFCSNLFMVVICIKFLNSIGWDRQKIGLYPKGYAIDIRKAFATAVILKIVQVLWLAAVVGKMFHVTSIPEQPLNTFVKDISTQNDVLSKILIVFVLVVTGPIFEEIFFRVLLFNFFRTYSNVFWGMFFSAFLFACVHMTTFSFPFYFLMGIVLNTMYLRTGSIYPSIMTHIFFNFIASLFLFHIIHH